MSSSSVGKSNPVAAFKAVSCELLRHPFASGDDLAKRPGAPLKYLLTAAALFLVTGAFGILGASVGQSPTLARTQWVVLALVLVALVVGNVVALVLSRTSDTPVEAWRFTAAAQYLVGLVLAGLAALTVAGLVGQVVISEWRGSLLETVVVVGTFGVGVLGVLLVLEVPRRILHLVESTYYGLVALIFLVLAGAARVLGFAG
jgi:hypothetical protein